MNISDFLSDDGQAILALCSGFGLPPQAPDLEPLKLSEWNQLARQIQDSPLRQPAALQGRTADELARQLGLAPAEAERVVRLLERAGRLALDVEGLFAKGMWVVTRTDPLYPARLRNALKHQAPTVLFGAGGQTGEDRRKYATSATGFGPKETVERPHRRTPAPRNQRAVV